MYVGIAEAGETVDGTRMAAPGRLPGRRSMRMCREVVSSFSLGHYQSRVRLVSIPRKRIESLLFGFRFAILHEVGSIGFGVRGVQVGRPFLFGGASIT